MILAQSQNYRRLWMLIAVAIVWVGVCGQEQEDIVELPPFVVIGYTLGPAWRYAKIDGFEILSQTSPEKTRAVVSALWLGRQMILPSTLLTRFSVPMIVVVFDQPPMKSGNLKSMGSVRGFNEVEEHWTNVIKRTLGDHESFAINLWQTEFRYSNSFRFDTFTLLAPRAPAVPGWLQRGLFGRYGLYREGWHWRLGDQFMGVTPAWWFSDQETAQVAQYYKTHVREAQFSDLSLSVAGDLDLLPFIPDLREVLSQQPAFSRSAAATSQLPSGPPATIQARGSSVMGDQTIVLPKIEVISDFPNRLASAAALFVRWGIYGRTREDTRKFWLFAERSCAEPVTEELFQECFGMSYEQARLELARYLPQAVSERAFARVGGMPPVPAFKRRDATPTEIARVRGEWEHTESEALSRRFPDLARQYREKARQTFSTVDDIPGERDPQFLASRGLLALDSGESARARELLELAAAGKVISPRVYYELAQLRWLKGSELTGKPSAEVIDGVIALLLTAESESPHLPGVYLFLAEAALRSGECSAEHLAALRRGSEYFPQDGRVCSRIAAALTHAQEASPAVVH